MTLKKAYIYALAEKGTNNYRYIGKSINPKKRTKNHIYFSKLKKTHKDMWIQSVIKNKKEIECLILEETNEIDWPIREKFWIKKLKKEGYKLTNHNNGGLGGGHIIYDKPFEEIKKWVQNNTSADSAKSWYKIVKKKQLPDFIPGNPKEVYLNKGWTSWGDFLGTGNKYDNDVNYILYNEAKIYIKENLSNITTASNWKSEAKLKKIPDNIPNRPERYYKNRGWNGWGDFLGTGEIANQNKEFFTYNKSKKWLLSNHPEINSVNKWYEFCKSNNFPKSIPKCPQLTYKNKGWISWPSFFSKH